MHIHTHTNTYTSQHIICTYASQHITCTSLDFIPSLIIRHTTCRTVNTIPSIDEIMHGVKPVKMETEFSPTLLEDREATLKPKAGDPRYTQISSLRRWRGENISLTATKRKKTAPVRASSSPCPNLNQLDGTNPTTRVFSSPSTCMKVRPICARVCGLCSAAFTCLCAYILSCVPFMYVCVCECRHCIFELRCGDPPI